jgi:hypothetical protein
VRGGASSQGSRGGEFGIRVSRQVGDGLGDELGGAKQVLLVEHPDRNTVILCIVFVVGAQAVEDIVMRAIDRIFFAKQE